MARRKVNRITLQGIKNLKRIDYWKFNHGNKLCYIYVGKTKEWFCKLNCGVSTDKKDAVPWVLHEAIAMGLATFKASDKLEFHFIKEFIV